MALKIFWLVLNLPIQQLYLLMSLIKIFMFIQWNLSLIICFHKPFHWQTFFNKMLCSAYIDSTRQWNGNIYLFFFWRIFQLATMLYSIYFFSFYLPMFICFKNFSIGFWLVSSELEKSHTCWTFACKFFYHSSNQQAMYLKVFGELNLIP